MVGRDTELRRLLRLAADPQPQVALLAGEAGIGKSRLISELIRSLPATTVVLAGQADPGSHGRPLEVLLDALGPADEDAALLADPSLAQIERLHAALTIVQRRVEGRAAVVVFDDLHFADPESITLFERLANLAERVLLLGSYRPDEVTSRSPLGAMIARLQHRHALTQLLLDRLDVAETSEFLTTATGTPPSYRSTVELHRRTGGNPFFLEELLRAGEGEDADALSEKPLPWSLAEALLRQLEDLDPVSRRTVETAAVLGHRVPFDLLAATTGTDEDTLIAQLRDLVGRGVLVETEPDEFSFRHALVREAIDHQLLARQRRRIHESALEILVATGGDDALVARHACGAGRYDDMVTAARRGSADYLAAGSPFQALQLAELGLQEAPDDNLLLDVATQSAWRARLFDDAIRHGSHWETVATTDADRAEAKCLLFLVAWAGDDLDQIERLTADLTQLAESLPDCRALGHAMVALAEGCIFRNRPEESLEWAERAAALGSSIGDVGIELSALLAKGLTLTSIADGTERAATLLHHVAERAEAAAEWIVAARAWRGFLYTLPPSSYAEQALFLEHMRRDAERAGYETLAVAASPQGRARLAMHDGDLRTAIDAIAAGMRRSGELAGAARSADYYLP
ncbi:MAG: hypothetical protein QOI42_943, partial [Frankiaceae bacterium]|nr:hypothetical protein [Frankiaceae bacterium]